MAITTRPGPVAAPAVPRPVAATGPAWLRVRTEPILTALTLASIFLAWYAVARLRVVSPLFVPHPAAVWTAFWEILTEGYRGVTLAEHLADSLYRVVAGFLLGVATAVPLGLAIGYSTRVQAIFDPLIEFYRPLPPLAYYTLLVIWLGIENASKIALLYLAAFPPLSVSAMQGVRGVSQERIQGAQSLGATRWQVLTGELRSEATPREKRKALPALRRMRVERRRAERPAPPDHWWSHARAG